MANQADFDALMRETQAKTAAAFTAMAAQQKETQIVMAAISTADPHNRQMLAMILGNPDLQAQVEAVVDAWFRAKHDATRAA